MRSDQMNNPEHFLEEKKEGKFGVLENFAWFLHI